MAVIVENGESYHITSLRARQQCTVLHLRFSSLQIWKAVCADANTFQCYCLQKNSPCVVRLSSFCLLTRTIPENKTALVIAYNDS